MSEQLLEFESPLRRTIRILFVEDNPADFELCLLALKRAKLSFHADIVVKATEFEERLLSAPYDIIVADYKLPGWTGMEALKFSRDCGKDIPFILVTGALGDETAVDCVRHGVADYILKDRLSRLPVAINRALQEQFLVQSRKQAVERLMESEEKFRKLAETIASAILIYRGTKCEYANRAAEIITCYNRDELLALDSWDLFHPDSRDTVVHMGLSWARRESPQQRYEARILTKTGEPKWLDITWSLVEFGGVRRGLVTAFDVTQRKRAEEEIRQLAVSDPLTGLANYRRLMEVFASEIERSRRTGRSFCLILLDLDGLKRINDRYGQLAGSRALCRVGNVLKSQCGSLDTAARYGGDEFAIIVPETGEAEGRHLARRIVNCVAEDGEHPCISLSFGVAVCPQDGAALKDVLRIADSGLYLMKGQALPKIADSA
jgi:diguanylate cyclase (GGDEF)-like protein/PAS domain S-box-containing protein